MLHEQINFSRLQITPFFKVVDNEIEIVDKEGPWILFISEMTFRDQVKKLNKCNFQLIDSDGNHILLDMMP